MSTPAAEPQPKPPWYQEGLRFDCTMCGDCCSGERGYVWFNEQEAGEMAAQLGIDVYAFYRTYAEREMGMWTLRNVRKGVDQYDCVFLIDLPGGKRGCKLYKARPTQCRTWPFWPENLKSRKAWGEALAKCPGMQQGNGGGGKFFPVEQIRILAKSNPKAPGI